MVCVREVFSGGEKGAGRRLFPRDRGAHGKRPDDRPLPDNSERPIPRPLSRVGLTWKVSVCRMYIVGSCSVFRPELGGTVEQSPEIGRIFFSPSASMLDGALPPPCCTALEESPQAMAFRKGDKLTPDNPCHATRDCGSPPLLPRLDRGRTADEQWSAVRGQQERARAPEPHVSRKFLPRRLS